jgi:hypothetical protein
MVRVCSINKPGRLMAVHTLSKVTMEECILHVKLMHWRIAARWRTVRMVAGFTTGENVWWKSTPGR